MAPRIRYRVAMSLDGYIAGPQGEFDWIVNDPSIDFGALFAQFDTFAMGRRTFELFRQPGSPPLPPGSNVFVFSRSLPGDVSGVSVMREVSGPVIASLREQARKDIWLFGGGDLFRSFLTLGVVETVEVAVIPVLLGGGRQLLPPPASQSRLSLTGHRVYPSGIVLLEYAVATLARHAQSR